MAEIAKKPLYRVTCGDIGTEPVDVEKVGLRSHFVLSSTNVPSTSNLYCSWARSGAVVSVNLNFYNRITETDDHRAVVLLDEADIFLEERTLNDLQRNALVSVFLRVLEYYSGT